MPREGGYEEQNPKDMEIFTIIGNLETEFQKMQEEKRRLNQVKFNG